MDFEFVCMLYWRKFFVLSRKVLLVVSISFKHLQTRRVGWYSVLCTLCSLPRSLRPSVQVGFLPVAFWTAAVIAVIIIERPSVFVWSNGTTSHGYASSEPALHVLATENSRCF